ncbi:SBBP repeat-containing protein [Deinococcus sp. YIM 134068]|uniref:SBBP repeat-containing protein n=1 Tax=Deinococcus lichenicola TaxID=3118910 RepID=UPI002F92C319
MREQQQRGERVGRRRVGLLLALSLGVVGCSETATVPSMSETGFQLEAEEASIEPGVTSQDVSDPIGGGRVIPDPAASGGRAVALWGTNDAVRFTVPSSLPAGRYTVKARGRGEAYQGWPTVALLDAQWRRLATTTLDTATYDQRSFGAFDLQPGQELVFRFLNDLYEGPGKDRNAVVDYLVIEPVQTSTPTEYAIQFGGGDNDLAYDVATDGSGNAYVVGTTTGVLPGQKSAGGHVDAFLRKVDTQGREVWTRQFGTDQADAASRVFLDAAGNVYVVGTTGGTYVDTSYGNMAPVFVADTFVRKYAPDGTELWTRRLGKNDATQTLTATVDTAGNIYAHGSVSGTLPGQANLGRTDAFIRKYAPDGTEVWVRQFGTEGVDNARLLSVDGSGNIYVSGLTTGIFPNAVVDGGNVQYVSKFSASGVQLWTRQFGTATVIGDLPTYKGYSILPDTFSGLQVDHNGNVYLAGYVQGSLSGQPAGGSTDTVVRKYGSDGALLWTRQSQDARLEYPAAGGSGPLGLDAAGNVYLAQFSSNPSSTTGEFKNAVLKYTPDGTLVTTRVLNTGSMKDKTGYFDADPFAKSLAVSASGQVFVAGNTRGMLPGYTNAASDTNNGSEDVFLFKLVP